MIQNQADSCALIILLLTDLLCPFTSSCALYAGSSLEVCAHTRAGPASTLHALICLRSSMRLRLCNLLLCRCMRLGSPCKVWRIESCADIVAIQSKRNAAAFHADAPCMHAASVVHFSTHPYEFNCSLNGCMAAAGNEEHFPVLRCGIHDTTLLLSHLDKQSAAWQHTVGAACQELHRLLVGKHTSSVLFQCFQLPLHCFQLHPVHKSFESCHVAASSRGLLQSLLNSQRHGLQHALMSLIAGPSQCLLDHNDMQLAAAGMPH